MYMILSAIKNSKKQTVVTLPSFSIFNNEHQMHKTNIASLGPAQL
jgi:hypothetical protein